MSHQLFVDPQVLRSAIQDEYGEVAACPTKGFHFIIGLELARRLNYPDERVDALPDAAVESFAGVGNPFSWGDLSPGDVVVDQGSGAGFDSLLAAQMVGPDGAVIGVDMTEAMLDKARRNAESVGAGNVAFRKGYLEELPIEDATADVVISNGVVNLCPDKPAVLAETWRVLKPGGTYRLSDIVVGKIVPDDAKADISLWTG